MKKTKQYFFEYTHDMRDFLNERGIPFVCGDADIMSVTLGGYNDNEFVLLILEFSYWIVSRTIKNQRQSND
jgi:hypothetical protein